MPGSPAVRAGSARLRDRAAACRVRAAGRAGGAGGRRLQRGAPAPAVTAGRRPARPRAALRRPRRAGRGRAVAGAAGRRGGHGHRLGRGPGAARAARPHQRGPDDRPTGVLAAGRGGVGGADRGAAARGGLAAGARLRLHPGRRRLGGPLHRDGGSRLRDRAASGPPARRGAPGGGRRGRSARGCAAAGGGPPGGEGCGRRGGVGQRGAPGTAGRGAGDGDVPPARLPAAPRGARPRRRGGGAGPAAGGAPRHHPRPARRVRAHLRRPRCHGPGGARPHRPVRAARVGEDWPVDGLPEAYVDGAADPASGRIGYRFRGRRPPWGWRCWRSCRSRCATRSCRGRSRPDVERPPVLPRLGRTCGELHACHSNLGAGRTTDV